jgi:Spy/CpxP family protein refolding chaperone
MRKILTFIVLLAGLGFTSPVKKCSTHYYLVEPVKLMPYLIKYKDQLNLTKEQKAKIKQLIRELKERVIPLDRQIDEYSEKVRRMFVENPNFYSVRAELKRLAMLKVKRSLYNYICIQNLKKILTEEQFKKLLQLAKPLEN